MTDRYSPPTGGPVDPADQYLPTDRPADSEFFPDPVDGHPRGQSWKTEIDGIRVTIGRMEAGTVARHTIEEPEIVIVHAGQVAIRLGVDLERGVRGLRYPYHPFGRNIMFGLPVGREFEFDVAAKEDQQVVEGETPSDFIYTCFYPKDEAEEERILRDLANQQPHPVHPFKYTMSQGYWEPEDAYRVARDDAQ